MANVQTTLKSSGKILPAKIFQKNKILMFFTIFFIRRLTDPCILRQTFFRQNDAFDFVARNSDQLHVFSFESKLSSEPQRRGRRQYIACSYRQFYHYYKQLRDKHHYELIPEGKPCRLYFDLEFPRERNPDADGERMVTTLIQVQSNPIITNRKGPAIWFVIMGFRYNGVSSFLYQNAIEFAGTAKMLRYNGDSL